MLEFPGESVEAISRAIRRYCRGLHPVKLSSEEKIEIDRKILRLSQELSEKDKLYNSLLQRENLADRLLNAFRESMDGREIVVPIPNIITSRTRKPVKVVWDISDIHHSEVVDPESTLGLGDFDSAMSRARIAFLIDKGLMITKEILGHPVDEAIVNILGDLVTGVIHDELTANAEMLIVDAVLDISITLSLAILELAREFKVVRVNGVSGNHGRFNKKMHSKEDAINNWDYIIYQFISIMLADQPNVICNFPRSFWCLTEINKFSSLLMHGQFIKSWATIPYYGIFRTATNLTDLININLRRKMLDKQGVDIVEIVNIKDPSLLDFRYIEMGHFHSAAILNKSSVEILMNGSVIGNGEYNIFNMANGQDPKQWLLIAHPEEGYTGRYPINLTHATRDMGTKYTTKLIGTVGNRFNMAKKLILERG
jgi:hypothetical protein